MRTLHPNLVPWLKGFNVLVARLIEAGFQASPINAREGLASLTRKNISRIPRIAWVQDDYVFTPGYNVPVRIYHPDPDTSLPVLIYYHGGGHMAGSVTVYDPICRKLAEATQHIVVAPEYRLAPECPYPAGLVDACNVAKYLWPTLERRGLCCQRRLSLGGDSAGGALAASVSGKAQYDAGVSIEKQVLIYPSLDYTLNTASIEENAVGYLLEKDKVVWYFDSYFANGEDRKSASPLFWEVGTGFPETLVITAEFCPLRDEGILYFEKLHSAGLTVKHLHFSDMIHTFINLEDVVPETCARLYQEIGTFLQTSIK